MTRRDRAEFRAWMADDMPDHPIFTAPRRSRCSCGSGMEARPITDGRGDYIGTACADCEGGKLGGYSVDAHHELRGAFDLEEL